MLSLDNVIKLVQVELVPVILFAYDICLMLSPSKLSKNMIFFRIIRMGSMFSSDYGLSEEELARLQNETGFTNGSVKRLYTRYKINDISL